MTLFSFYLSPESLDIKDISLIPSPITPLGFEGFSSFRSIAAALPPFTFSSESSFRVNPFLRYYHIVTRAFIEDSCPTSPSLIPSPFLVTRAQTLLNFDRNPVVSMLPHVWQELRPYFQLSLLLVPDLSYSPVRSPKHLDPSPVSDPPTVRYEVCRPQENPPSFGISLGTPAPIEASRQSPPPFFFFQCMTSPTF